MVCHKGTTRGINPASGTANIQSELIGQCMATPHHLSDVRRGAPS